MSKGIDISIDNLITTFTSRLWTDAARAFIGRVYRNERLDSFGVKLSPEYFNNTTQRYECVLRDRRYDAQCFFDLQPDITTNKSLDIGVVWIVFMVNLTTLYPSLTRQEAEEQVIGDARNLVTCSEFEIKRLVRGFKSVMEYNWGDNANQALVDMNNNYCFRFEAELDYQFLNC